MLVITESRRREKEMSDDEVKLVELRGSAETARGGVAGGTGESAKARVEGRGREGGRGAFNELFKGLR
jgi:hypothetical protein